MTKIRSITKYYISWNDFIIIIEALIAVIFQIDYDYVIIFFV